MINNLGENIKGLRKQNKMTLKVLADKTGFSISFLSQLERGKSSATLESLKKISLVFGVNPGYFFNEADEDEKIVSNRKLETEQIEEHNIYYKNLSKSLESPAFAPLLVILKPNQNEGNLFKHSGQEFLYVLEGQLTVLIDEDIHVLNSSDSIMFDSNKKHYWYNYTNQSVKFLCVNYDEFLD